MMMNNKNNNKHHNTTVIKEKPLDENNRFCRICYLGLVKKQSGVYSCPRCNCSAVTQNTYPSTSLRTTFPTYSPYEPNKIHVMQSETQKLPRSEVYIRKRAEEKNQDENQDPYLKILRSRGDLHLTNVEYYNVEE